MSERMEPEQSDLTGVLHTNAEFDSAISEVTMYEVQEFPEFDLLYPKTASINSRDEKVQGDTEYDIGYEIASPKSIFTNNNPTMTKAIMEELLPSNCGNDKPTQVVFPLVNSGHLKVTKSQTTTSTLERIMSDILTFAEEGLDRFESTHGNIIPDVATHSADDSYHIGSLDVGYLHSYRSTLRKHEQQNLQLLQENMKLKSFKSINEVLQKKIKALCEEKQSWLCREFKLIEQIKNRDLSLKQKAIAIEEYEKTISTLIDEHHKEILHYEEEFKLATIERHDMLEHLAAMESNFNNLLTNYQKCKNLLYDLQDKENVLNQILLDTEEGIKKQEIAYNKLKEMSSECIRKGETSLENIKKAHSTNVLKLTATIKRNEAKISSLQESLQQKLTDQEEFSKMINQLPKKAD